MDVRIGLQLYSVRQSLAEDPWGTLAQIAQAGFTRLEAANLLTAAPQPLLRYAGSIATARVYEPVAK